MDTKLLVSLFRRCFSAGTIDVPSEYESGRRPVGKLHYIDLRGGPGVAVRFCDWRAQPDTPLVRVCFGTNTKPLAPSPPYAFLDVTFDGRSVSLEVEFGPVRREFPDDGLTTEDPETKRRVGPRRRTWQAGLDRAGLLSWTLDADHRTDWTQNRVAGRAYVDLLGWLFRKQTVQIIRGKPRTHKLALPEGTYTVQTQRVTSIQRARVAYLARVICHVEVTCPQGIAVPARHDDEGYTKPGHCTGTTCTCESMVGQMVARTTRSKEAFAWFERMVRARRGPSVETWKPRVIARATSKQVDGVTVYETQDPTTGAWNEHGPMKTMEIPAAWRLQVPSWVGTVLGMGALLVMSTGIFWKMKKP